MSRSPKRQLHAFLTKAEKWSTSLGLGLITFYFIMNLPLDLLRQGPATGGDMGSHFWPLYTLVNYGLSNLTWPVWNPGNLAGEPQLLHYFPLPFFVMAGMSTALPIGMAFNWGTLIPLLLLPFAVFFCVRALGYPFPAPLMSASFSLLFQYNESYSMWGGNALSTLAGQFAHGYALCFLLLGVGSLALEVKRERFPLLSALFFAGVATSHAYVEIAVPVFLVSMGFFLSCANRPGCLAKCCLSGVLSILFSVWFLVPMFLNNRWTTSMAMKWDSGKLLEEVLPLTLYPALAIIFLFVFLSAFLWRRHRLRHFRPVVSQINIWTIPIVAYLLCYFIFPNVGLVDVRAIPQIQLFVCIVAGMMIATMLRQVGRIVAWCTSLPFVFLVVLWVDSSVVQLPQWLRWNYSGWDSKVLYPALLELSEELRGNFSQGRVVYEHSGQNLGAGTERVFEMLPYFAGRATLESVYTQANVVSPMVYYTQALVSKTPSCPLWQFDCARLSIETSGDQLELMGVDTLILISPEAIKQAQEAAFLTEGKTIGPWTLFYLIHKPKLIRILRQPPIVIEEHDWRNSFYDWYRNYTAETRFQLLRSTMGGSGADVLFSAQYLVEKRCSPEAHVDFNQIRLTTNCPGSLHLVKFAYHPSWRANDNSEIFMVSPGYMALIPTTAEVMLSFGHDWRWSAAFWVSAILLLIAFCWSIYDYRLRGD